MTTTMAYSTVNIIGGISFALWGLMHVIAGGLGLWIFYTRGTESMLDFVDIDASVNEQAARMRDLVAEFYQALLLIGLTVTIVGLTLNLKGDPLGLILNAILVISIEVYFVWYEVRPGHRPVSAAIVSIVLLFGGIVFCGMGVDTWIW
jgi:hypothetical protein